MRGALGWGCRADRDIPGKMCSPVLPTRGCPDTSGQGHPLSPSQVLGQPAHCGNSLHTRALAEETPLPQAQGGGWISCRHIPKSGAGCHSPESPVAGGHRQQGDRSKSQPSPALKAPPTPELTLRDIRDLESPFQHQLPAATALQGDRGQASSAWSELSQLGQLFPGHLTQAEPLNLLPTPSSQYCFYFMPVPGSPVPQQPSCSGCKPSGVTAPSASRPSASGTCLALTPRVLRQDFKSYFVSKTLQDRALGMNVSYDKCPFC